MGKALRVCRSFIMGKVRSMMELIVVCIYIESLTLQIHRLCKLPVMKVKNKLQHSNHTLVHRDLIDWSVIFNWKCKGMLNRESAIMWNGTVPGLLLCPGGIMDSQEVTRLSVLRLTCEGHHRSNWSLGTVITWEWGFYFLQWNSPCLDDSTIIGWGDLEKSSLHEHFFCFNFLLKISELNLEFGLHLTKWIIIQIMILCRIKDRILCRIKDRILKN